MGNFAKHCDDSSRMEKDGESHKPMRCELSAWSFRKEANNPLGRSAKKRRRPSAMMTRTPPRAFRRCVHDSSSYQNPSRLKNAAHMLSNAVSARLHRSRRSRSKTHSSVILHSTARYCLLSPAPVVFIPCV